MSAGDRISDPFAVEIDPSTCKQKHLGPNLVRLESSGAIPVSKGEDKCPSTFDSALENAAVSFSRKYQKPTSRMRRELNRKGRFGSHETTDHASISIVHSHAPHHISLYRSRPTCTTHRHNAQHQARDS